MKCEFEEKQFEQHLNNELSLRQDMLYVPGQVLEGRLGFDAAVYSANPRFWHLFGASPILHWFNWRWLRSPRPGVELRWEWWASLEEGLSYFPRFRFNLFLQHKRPERLTAPSSKEWSYWNRPYFRYDLVTHQQRALENLEARTERNALVVYSAPAFATLDELWDAIRNQKLTETSNFCQPSNLSGHARYSYSDPGNTGIAHSDPEEVESYAFYQRLRTFREEAESTEDNKSFLVKIGQQVQASIEDCGAATESYFTILKSFESRNESDFYQAMVRISAFNFVLGARWLVGADLDARS